MEERKVEIKVHPLLMMGTPPKAPTSSGASSLAAAPLVPQAAFSSVQANIRAGRKESTLLKAEGKGARLPAPDKAVRDFLAVRPPDLARRNPHFDRRLPGVPTAGHRPRRLAFLPQGALVAEAERVRAEAEFERLRREVAEGLGGVGVDTEIVADLLVGEEAASWSWMPADDIEWWDAPLVSRDDEKKLTLSLDAITNLIQRPALLPPPVDVEAAVPAKPLMLTAPERKKLRRQRRLAEQQERQEQVRLGLRPPDPQKTRIASIPRLLGAQSVQEPSRVEGEIRAQALARHQAHLQANQERAELARQARTAKLAAASGIGPNEVLYSVAVFRIERVPVPQWRFKLFRNAQQHHLTGCILYYPAFVLVVVEGAATPLRRYKHLLLERIDWTSPPADFATDPETGPYDFARNACTLLWEGAGAQRSFWKLEYKTIESDIDAREYLCRFGAEHYWRLAKGLSVVPEGGNNK